MRIRFPLACREEFVTELQYRVSTMPGARASFLCREFAHPEPAIERTLKGTSMKNRQANSTTLLRRSLLTAAILGAGCIGTAHAADDQSLTWNGITLYGVVDVDVSYQNHGAPLSQDFYTGLAYLVQKYSNKSITSIGPSGLSQSKV